MDEKFNSILSITLIPQIIELMEKNDGLNGNAALNQFYNSATYEMLSNEETKIWHFSPMTIYTMWKHENETGEIAFPEE